MKTVTGHRRKRLPRELEFCKLSACGNDFVAVDNRRGLLAGTETGLIRYLCDRRSCAGADGLLLLEDSSEADCRMRIFNPDGGEARMCGNGARCFATFASSLGFPGKLLHIETPAGLQEVHLEGDRSRLVLGEIGGLDRFRHSRFSEPAFAAGLAGAIPLGYVRAGVPHFVSLVERGLSAFPLEQAGEFVRRHPLFEPEGVNAMFIERTAGGALNLRAWEKGVEGETLGCGTGAIAACALLGASNGEPGLPRRVEMAGGELLVDRDESGRYSFSGEVHLCYKAIAPLPDGLDGC